MEEIKNSNEVIEDTVTDTDTVEAAPEEVMEVVLQDTEDAEDTERADDAEVVEEAPAELSGLTEKQRQRKIIFDKITTALLVLLLIAPVAIIAYIFLWFIFR